jgi:acyl carrier protein
MITMDRTRVLAVMVEFVRERLPEVRADEVEQRTAGVVIRQSLEFVEFILHFEERLGFEVNINDFGETLLTSTFGQLADQIIAVTQPLPAIPPSAAVARVEA